MPTFWEIWRIYIVNGGVSQMRCVWQDGTEMVQVGHSGIQGEEGAELYLHQRTINVKYFTNLTLLISHITPDFHHLGCLSIPRLVASALLFANHCM